MSKPSPFLWYELMTPDLDAAAAFYRRVVGWESKDAAMPGMRYEMFAAGASPIAGGMALTPEMRAAGAQPGWIGYIGVEDVDATAARVTAAGGKVYRAAADIPGVGRFAVVADPWGAVFMLFRPVSQEGPPQPAPGTPGTIGWHELHAGDGVAAFRFYESLFGWTKAEAMDMGPMGVYQIFATGGTVGGGMMTKMPQSPASFWLYYFNVETLDAALARATGAGATVINGPMEVPGGRWMVQCIDPQGVMFALLAAKR